MKDATEAAVRQPSLLPGWTRGHVLTHLARNAEAMCRRMDAAARGDVIEQYVGGAVGRAAEIEAGAGRQAHQIVEDVLAWASQLDAAFTALGPDVWATPAMNIRSRGCRSGGGARWRFTWWTWISGSLIRTGLRRLSTARFQPCWTGCLTEAIPAS